MEIRMLLMLTFNAKQIVDYYFDDYAHRPEYCKEECAFVAPSISEVINFYLNYHEGLSDSMYDSLMLNSEQKKNLQTAIDEKVKALKDSVKINTDEVGILFNTLSNVVPTAYLNNIENWRNQWEKETFSEKDELNTVLDMVRSWLSCFW